MEFDTTLVKFCERKLYPNRPEYLNCVTALYVTYVAYKGLQNKGLSKNAEFIFWSIGINGICSFLFHYTAIYLFKLFDEFTMIVPLWIGVNSLLHDLGYLGIYMALLNIYNSTLLVLDIFPWFDDFFPIALAVELLFLIPLCYQLSVMRHSLINQDRRMSRLGLHGILISSASGAIWFLTELNCNKYMIIGHPIWHIGMSTGMSYIVNFCNDETKYIKQKRA